MNETQDQTKQPIGVSRKTLSLVVGVLLLGQLVITIIVGTFIVNQQNYSGDPRSGAWGGSRTANVQKTPATGTNMGGGAFVMGLLEGQVEAADKALDAYSAEMAEEQFNPNTIRQEIPVPSLNR